MHELDPLGNRPVSANQNGWVGPTTPLDVQGFDYSTQNYDKWHAAAYASPAGQLYPDGGPIRYRPLTFTYNGPPCGCISTCR